MNYKGRRIMEKEKEKIIRKILVTGGGTGGHAVPLMAVIDELKKNNADILYVGSGTEIERKLASEHKVKYKAILSGKYRRYFDWQNFIDFFKIIIGFIQSFFIILFFWPERVFSKGGYVGLPIVWAAWLLGRPIYIHETDSILGLANRLSLNKCKKVFVSWPVKYYHNLPVDKVIYTGNPIRSAEKKVIACDKKPMILVTGGSQGARFINQTVAAILKQLTEKYQVVHICGKLDYEWLSKNNWPNYKLFDYTDKFLIYLSQARLVISRSGGTIFELAAYKKPAIIIPLPSAANNHQEANARILEKENAAIVLREKGLTSESLLEIIHRVMEDKDMQYDLSERIGQFANPDAVKTIVKNILV